MADDTVLSCRCGQTRWRIDPAARGTKLICYCADCQTYARHLDAPGWLDAAGGTTIFQTLPCNVAFLDGAENLALLRLGPRGLYRWHTACCGTPVANTLTKTALPFAGLVLPAGAPLFGPVTARVQTDAALRPVRDHGLARSGVAILARALGARLSGRTGTPFFDGDGRPVRQARVLTQAERKAARPG